MPASNSSSFSGGKSASKIRPMEVQNAGMPERQNTRPQMKMPVILGARKSKFRKRVKTTTHRGARKSRFVADLRNRKLSLRLREHLNHREAPGERGHKVGVALQLVVLRNWRGHGWDGAADAAAVRERFLKPAFEPATGIGAPSTASRRTKENTLILADRRTRFR